MNRCKELDAYFRLPGTVATARGDEVVLEDGRQLLDLYGGHCVNTLGAGDTGVSSAVARQWAELSFTTNLFDHGSRQSFLDAFGSTLPSGDWNVFLSNSGAEANENALKAALSATGRSRVLAFDGAFHGRTAAAEAVTDTKKRAYPRSPFDVERVPFGDLEQVSTALDDSFAAVILEPIQSMAGIVVPPEGFLAGLRELCSRHGVALIFDEVQTGNGRLGTGWASQAFDVIPDVFTTAKGAASGLPIGITVLSNDIAQKVGSGLFGSTFGGGPTILAAATEVSKRIAEGQLLENVRAASAAFSTQAVTGPVVSVRGVGLLLGLELEAGLTAGNVRDSLYSSGILVGTSANPSVLRLLPPLTIQPKSAELLSQALASFSNVEVTS